MQSQKGLVTNKIYFLPAKLPPFPPHPWCRLSWVRTSNRSCTCLNGSRAGSSRWASSLVQWCYLRSRSWKLRAGVIVCLILCDWQRFFVHKLLWRFVVVFFPGKILYSHCASEIMYLVLGSGYKIAVYGRVRELVIDLLKDSFAGSQAISPLMHLNPNNANLWSKREEGREEGREDWKKNKLGRGGEKEENPKEKKWGRKGKATKSRTLDWQGGWKEFSDLSVPSSSFMIKHARKDL